MKIPKGAKANFETLIDAAKNSDLALMDCFDEATGESVAAVCAVNQIDGEFQMVPIAIMPYCNLFERLIPPTTEGGYLK